ncbi:MAG: hypothetical protein KDC59_17720, partial [Saprospiraceae bacterium]|nr:hypothetical protein [Saprospiraceae bacterium]
MRKWTILVWVMMATGLWGQNPHGAAFTMDCAKCHTPTGWTPLLNTLAFSHDTTAFPLLGAHQTVDCKLCHTTLVFDQAPLDCFGCHTDVHQQTVGPDCARCHDSRSWIVDDITDIHRQDGFALVGAHATAD